MGTTKNDGHAHRHWGAAYDAIPKSVWASVAWHLANLASGECDTPGAAEMRFAEEVGALADNGIIPKPQAIAAVRALSKAA